MTCRTLIGLQPGNVTGEINFESTNILELSDAQLSRLRGREISMVFQDPMTSLNPLRTIGSQLIDGIRRHEGLSKHQALKRAAELLGHVGVPGPEKKLKAYPHTLSGGMRQRVMIAMALACKPRVLIADEPTTALDVTIEAQILDLIKDMQEELDMAVIWISHDLGVVAGIADRVIVMYAGTVLESGPTAEVFANPAHPYTKGLLGSRPDLHAGADDLLIPIPGQPPTLNLIPEGCVFYPRCSIRADPRCENTRPTLQEVGPDHFSASFYNASHAVPANLTREETL